MADPATPFDDLERFFGRMSEQFGESADPMGILSRESDGVPVDLVEHDDEFVLNADLPGYSREDVTVRVADRRVRVEAERSEATETAKGSYIRNERRHQSVRRSVRLPEPVEANAVTAQMQNGVLTVRLPRHDTAEAHTVEIE